MLMLYILLHIRQHWFLRGKIWISVCKRQWNIWSHHLVNFGFFLLKAVPFAFLSLVFYICCTEDHKFSHPVRKALRLTCVVTDISCCYLLSAKNSEINLGYACQYSRSLPSSCFLYELHSHQTWLFETFVACVGFLMRKRLVGNTVPNIGSLFPCCFSHLTWFCCTCTCSVGCFLVCGYYEVWGLMKVILS